MDQDDLADVLTSASQTHGENAVLTLLDAAADAYASGKDVDLPGLTEENATDAGTAVAAILDEYQRTARLGKR